MKSSFKSALLLIHYWFPVALGWSVTLVLHKATGFPILPFGMMLYLLAIWAAYSLDRLIDPADQARPLWLKILLTVGVIVPAILGSMIALSLLPQTIVLAILFALITFFYHKAKKFPFFKTLLVAIVWVWAGVALPFQNENLFAWQFWTTQTSLPLVLLVAAGTILCDFKDLQFDKGDGVHSLPVMLGLRNTMLATSTLLMVVAAISYEQGRMGLVVSSIALIGLAQFPNLLALDAIGPLLVDAALTIPGLLIFLRWV